jgi:hypothetical protein
MKPESPSSNFTPERCQHRTRTGRQCRSSVAHPGSAFCNAHASSEPSDSQDFVATLTKHACSFQNAQGINHSLGTLYRLLAQGRISPRRASVLAYISNLLLRSLTAIDNDRHPNAGRPGHNSPKPVSSAANSAQDDLADEQHASEGEAPIVMAATQKRKIPPGKDPLPATGAAFVDAVLKGQKPN